MNADAVVGGDGPCPQPPVAKPSPAAGKTTGHALGAASGTAPGAASGHAPGAASGPAPGATGHAPGVATGHAPGVTTGHTPVQDEGPPAKARRKLVAQATLDAKDLVAIHQDMKARVLKADTLKGLSGLPNLAKEHISHFKRVYGGRLAPNKTIFIASAPTGTTADSFPFYAAREALKTLYPELL